MMRVRRMWRLRNSGGNIGSSMRRGLGRGVGGCWDCEGYDD